MLPCAMDFALLQNILGELLKQLQLPFDRIDVKEEEDFFRVDIVSPQPSKLIGWHGETLNSLQHLLKSIMRTQMKMEKSPFLVLDTDGYRLMQEDKVRQAAERKADFVRRTGSRIALPPMSPYFRRIVHMHVSNSPALQDLTTMSTGEGDYRQVVLRLKEEKKLANVRESSGELSPVMDDTPNEGLENLDI